MINDPIADLLTRIRNANQRKKKTVSAPYSKVKNEILKILKNEGYIIDFKVDGEKTNKKLVIFLKYKGNQKVITGLRRISKPGFRVYSEAEKLPKVLNGYGTGIISTSKGIMTDDQARELKLGGEVLAFIW
ncbi:MAG: 30S ribosomal protein S8 [Candidatus Tyloplasma litorale]|nr:MAG: 30S ribosomal protein S8 [Mycoplasmatales bacterium]